MTINIKITENWTGTETHYTTSHDTDTVKLFEALRAAARAERWTTVAGIKEFAKKEYKIKLNTNIYGDWTSMTFNDELTLNNFLSRIGNVRC